MFTNALMNLPVQLISSTQKNIDAFIMACQKNDLCVPSIEIFFRELVTCFACSQFIADIAINFPQEFIQCYQTNFFSDDFQQHDCPQNLSENNFYLALQKLLITVSEEAELMRQLRIFRRWHMCRIAWRDICGQAPLQQVIMNLSALADAMIAITVEKLMQSQVSQLGAPLSKHRHPQQLIVLAVGKLGSYELNFSSDIDLIFCFSGSGHTHGKANAMPSEQFFLRLAQRVIKVLSHVSVDGSCFRVDMRLRPYGSSGALIASFSAMTTYFQQQGREWERFALAKARIVYGDGIGFQLMDTIKQFVFRKYVDYGAIESLRQMKALIDKEGQSLKLDIKRGEGGIREIEFIAQVFQLIRGGKESWLQETKIFKILPLLATTHCLPLEVVNELLAAYKFLRKTEHRLQEYNDQQTHSLPTIEIDRIRLAYGMGFTNWELFIEELHHHQNNVIKHFEKTIAKPVIASTEHLLKLDPKLSQLLNGQLNFDNALELLIDIGFKEPQKILCRLGELQQSFNFRHMDTEAAKRLQLLFQYLLPLIAKDPNEDILCKRINHILEAVVRRSVYLVLLLENPSAIKRLVELCAASPWITDLLAHFPFLLEELLDSQTLYLPFSPEKINDQLRQYMLNLPADDLEQQMDCLRRFKQAQILRVATSDLTGALPLMKVSDHLTNMACVITAYAKHLAWRVLVKRCGAPQQNGEYFNTDNFAIIAYGKLGGLELGYGSDLDLVFLHNINDLSALTDGEKPLTYAEFLTRLAQRIIHILSVGTEAGSLYEIDTRLRPSGQSGLLVSSFQGFAEYQREKAWVWEHQALVRARVIEGSETFIKDFQHLRGEILSQKRNTSELKKSVINMRDKMRQAAKKFSNDFFDVDQDTGGIKDIEFIVQFGVLNWGHQYPNIFEFTDNIRILEAFADCNILTQEEAKQLSDSYLAYRQINHRCSLQNQPALIAASEFTVYRDCVRHVWEKFFNSPD